MSLLSQICFSVKTIKHSRLLSYFITTPIFYVNSSPHIGHVHTLLLADALNIYHRLKFRTNNTIFSTGTDEHGIKIQTAAEVSNTSLNDFCEQNSKKFIDLFRHYDTSITDFIRTSEDRHVEAVKSVWTQLENAGFIHKSTYSGWYCNSDEVFIPESQVVEVNVNGQMTHQDQNGNQLIWSSEDNYVFRYSLVRDRIYDWLKTRTPVLPAKFNDEALAMMEQLGLSDISISRPSKRLHWGIKVPGDSTQTIYVWLDALTNYLTVAGYPCEKSELKRWPVDCQVIGKDIIKFHAIYWPAFLSALELPPPRKIICHSHWLIESLKMSKSRGNVIDPVEENQIFSVEGLRYYLLRAGTPHSDNDYSRIQALRRINAELADTYGNLMSRSCAPAINPLQRIPIKMFEAPCSQILEIVDRLKAVAISCENHYDCANFYKGIDDIMATLRLNNVLYERSKPWKLVKNIHMDDRSLKEYMNVQAVTFEALRICSILLQPIVPKLANLALDRLNVKARSWVDSHVCLEYGDPVNCYRSINQDIESVLFRRLKASEAELEYKSKN